MNKPIRNTALNLSSRSKESSQPYLSRYASMSDEARNTIKALLRYQGPKNWNGLSVVPPDSFLEDILELFRSETDIPLELPLATVLSFVSSFLNSVQAKYEIGGTLMPAKLWTVVLAPSGSGKTFTAATISKWLEGPAGETVVPLIQSASSAAQFAVNLESTSRGLMLRDEFGQYLSQIQNLRHMEETKDMLLQAYSGSPIQRLTKETQIIIPEHAITILGITVGETFESQIGADSLVDGFAQRFNYIISKTDPSRPFVDHPIYFDGLKKPEQSQRLNRIKQQWHHLIARNDLPMAVFKFDDEAINLFKEGFRKLFQDSEIPHSFYRRTLFSVFSYAVVFHVLAGRMGTTVDRESISYAVRMVALHLGTAKDLLNGFGLSDLEKTLRKAEGLKEKVEAKGEKLTTRRLISGVREIKNTAQAKSILDLIK